MSLSELPLGVSIAVFLVSALVIGVVGTRLAGVSDRLADRTGWGEAFVGAVFLGAATSLPGITASVTAAVDGRPELALSNALGGIAAQTAFLAIADIAYRKANLEHAAASVPNMMQGAVLIILLSVMLLGVVGPDISVLGIHVVTPGMLIVYVLGMKMVYRAHTRPMWNPRMTSQTRLDEPQEAGREEPTLAALWGAFIVTAAIVVIAGWGLTKAAESVSSRTGISDSIVGASMTAIATSLPELVTSIAAVRRGALTLAVGGVIGGNAFDTLFAAVADVAYRPGSIYHAASSHEVFLVALTILMTAVLLLGLLRREKSGIANIGFEGFFVLLLYVGGMIALIVRQ